jgi:DNA-binding response OmpR family regulator
MEPCHTNKITPKRILLVDDEPAITRTMQLILMQDQHQVEIAGDSAAALRVYDTGRFDLVILDFRMPEVDGLELARLIRVWNPTQPILLVSANLEEMVRTGGRMEYFNNVLEKPFSVEALRFAVADSLPSA